MKLIARILVTVFFILACVALGTQVQAICAPAVVVECPEPMLESEPIPILVEAPNYGRFCDREAPDDFDTLVEGAASDYGLDPRILAQTVYRESDCKAGAQGTSGEIGLTQVNPSVWLSTLQAEGLITTESDLWAPATNLRAGAFILSRMADRADKDPQETFRRYNGSGPKARRYARAQMRDYLTNWGEIPSL